MPYTKLQSLLRTALNRSGTGHERLMEAARSQCVVPGADTTLLSSDGATMDSTAHLIDVAIGNVLLGGLHDSIAALTDQSLIAADFGYKLDGTTPALLTDLMSVEIALCAIIVNGAAALVAVFGAEALTGAEVAPTASECRIALEKAGITNHLASGIGIITGRLDLARSGGTVTATHVAAASNEALKSERLAGGLG